MGIREQLTNLSPREQKLLTALAVVFGALVLLGVPAYVYADLSASRSRNEEMRELLDRMGKASELLALRRSERAALDLRYARPAPALASFLESAATANGLEVPESTDRPDVEGKGYTERITVVKMRSVNLKPLVKMLEKLERSGHPVAITQLQIKARASSPDLYDVQLGVSAYDREGTTKPEETGSPSGSAPPPRGTGIDKGKPPTDPDEDAEEEPAPRRRTPRKGRAL